MAEITPTPTPSSIPCLEYQISNNSNLNAEEVIYVDCDGLSTSVIIPPLDTISLCLRSYVAQPGITYTLVGTCVTISPTATPTPTPTPTPTTQQNLCVVNYGASMTPCFGGTVDNYMEGFVELNDTTSINLPFTIEVAYIPGGSNLNCNSLPLSYTELDVEVLAGQTYGLLTCPVSPFIDDDGATICGTILVDSPLPICSEITPTPTLTPTNTSTPTLTPTGSQTPSETCDCTYTLNVKEFNGNTDPITPNSQYNFQNYFIRNEVDNTFTTYVRLNDETTKECLNGDSDVTSEVTDGLIKTNISFNISGISPLNQVTSIDMIDNGNPTTIVVPPGNGDSPAALANFLESNFSGQFDAESVGSTIVKIKTKTTNTGGFNPNGSYVIGGVTVPFSDTITSANPNISASSTVPCGTLNILLAVNSNPILGVPGSGSHIWVDYNNVTMSLNPTGDINILSGQYNTTCTTDPCPTPTPTPTNTPTSTPTPTSEVPETSTPTPTPTPTITLSPNITVKNDCEVLTLFPLGIECSVISPPTDVNSFDGILGIKVTGGTAPYAYYWSGIQGGNSKSGLLPGNYPVTVIDYYGDYTANTICVLAGPSPTPVPTQTVTPTPTQIIECQNICMYIIGEFVSYGPWLFTCNGIENGKYTWNYFDDINNISYNIVWISSRNRWELVDDDMISPIIFDEGIIVSLTSSLIPLSSWQFFGGTGNSPQIFVSSEVCPEALPLNVTLSVQNASCLNNNGSIIATAQYGVSPYQYSINIGSYGSNNIFNGLSPGNYTIRVKDFENTIVTKTATIINTQTPISYTLSLVNLGSNSITPLANQLLQTCNYGVIVDPPIQAGTVISFNLNLSYKIENNSPWLNDDPSQTAEYQITTIVEKNGSEISPLDPSSLITSLTNRPDCSPNEIYTEFSGETATNIQIIGGDNVEGNTSVLLNIFSPQIDQNGCQSLMRSEITISINSINISGCDCCNINTTTSELVYVEILPGFAI